MKMQNQFVIWLLLAGFCYSSGSPCDITDVTECYNEAVRHDSYVFPFYGENAIELDETCRNVNNTFRCMEEYGNTCFAHSECDEDCFDLIKRIHSFIRVTKLKEFIGELCSEDAYLKKLYLENVECFKENSESYALCHEDSQKSLEYMSNSFDPGNICCYLNWYQGCFTNATRRNCAEKANLFVSFSLQKLVSGVAESICRNQHVVCSRPPLPPNTNKNSIADV